MSSTTAISIIGCGYIGKRLAQQLLEKKLAVRGYVSSKSSQEACREKHIQCNIIDLDTPLESLDLKNQHIIYLAPPPPKGKQDSRLTNFLAAIKTQRPARFVLISTTGVYGNCDGDWVNESATLQPVADRAFRRADAEQQVQNYCQQHNTPLVILRVPGIYGPDKLPVARLNSGAPIVNEKDSPFTNRIHAEDLVSICVEALLNDNICNTYNVSDGNPGTMYEYFVAVAKALGLPEPNAISLEEARSKLSSGMLSYMAESRRIDNSKMLNDFTTKLKYPNLKSGLLNIQKDPAS